MNSKPGLRHCLALALFAAAAGACLAQSDAGSATAAAPHSEMMRLATREALILDFAQATSRAIAVGERGTILLSESGSDWRQVPEVPTRANLTAVATAGDLAWAVGHDGTILHSADAGATWQVQRSDPWRPPAVDEPFDPRQGVPLLDVLMLDASNGFAVGAYSLMLRTADGGQTWAPVDPFAGQEAGSDADAEAQADADAADAADAVAEDSWTFDEADLELEEESDPHLNAITRTGSGALFIVAERGAAFRSRDGGSRWERLQLPYEGSMFGVLGYEGERVIAFGMRGNAFESADLGDSWQALETGTELSLMGGVALPSGGAVMVGANGVVLHRAAAQAPITRHTYTNDASETPVLAGVIARDDGGLVVGGDRGVGHYIIQTQ